MTPNFAKAVDPVFLHVLGLLERINQGSAANPAEEKHTISNFLRDAEAQLGQKADWELAKYALVSWVDEVLIVAPWEGRDWWNNNPLEVDHFRSRDCNTVFFTRAKEAAQLSRRDALEVYYVCVVLGFRGFYQSAGADAPLVARQLDVPPDLESWASQTARSIQLGQGRPPIGGSVRPLEGAPPLEGKYVLLGTSLLGGVLAAVATTTGVILFYLAQG
jgi:type VI secretion system protein ImpK